MDTAAVVSTVVCRILSIWILSRVGPVAGVVDMAGVVFGIL